MKLSGTYRMRAPQNRVWQALNSPEVLRQCTPGCKQMTPAADGSYNVLMDVAVGAVRGSYSGKIQISDPVKGSQYRLTVTGTGNTGFLKAEGVVQLKTFDEETVIEYTGEVQVGGLIAGVGQRVTDGVAKNIVGQFFKAFEAVVRKQGVE